MAEQDAGGATDTISVYRAGAVWIVGLSGAAVAGAFLNFDKIATAPLPVRIIFFAAAAAFAVSVAFGIEYYFWLNYAANQMDARKQRDAIIADPNAENEKKELAKQSKAEVQQKVTKAFQQIDVWQKRTRIFFYAGLGIASLLLLIGALGGAPPKTDATTAGIQNILTNPPEAPAAGYEIVQSAQHATRHGKEAHTFLLDKKTGAIWQMKCTKNSDDVEFHRVHRFGFDGKAEDPQP
jgi:hypothetical protein